jgi:ubiquitin-like 1-activating enzyme E1 A
MVDPAKVHPFLLLRLLNSRVLITPANGPNTELAKNLILAGVNLTIYDDSIVTEDDF